MTEAASGPPTTDWEELLKTWLHDPPDKALSIRGHETRAVRYQAAALGYEPEGARDTKETVTGDILSSVADRLPLPNPGKNFERAVGPDSGELRIVHPLSGEPSNLDTPGLDPDFVEDTIASIIKGIPDPDMRRRYLALWRLLPERLAADHPFYSRLPAETRVPDHSIWQHLDAAAALSLAHQGGKPAFLSYVLGPVQPFIAAARSLRDLWTGSAILSWLTFRGLQPILEALGPTSLVYPALRGAPLADLWLREQGFEDLIDPPAKTKLRSPSIPNRFVAVVPAGPDGGWAKELGEACRAATLDAWRELNSNAHDSFKRAVEDLTIPWDERWTHNWQAQVESYLTVSVAVLPWQECEENTLAGLWGKSNFEDAFPHVASVRKLNTLIPGGDRYGTNGGATRTGQWQTLLEMSTRLMEEQRRIRHVPAYAPVADEHGRYPAKCTLFGTYEQIGPADLSEAAAHWKMLGTKFNLKGIRLDENERFCAIALTKRLAPAGVLSDQLHLKPQDLRFSDTATLAAATWLKDQEVYPEDYPKVWNGQWLHLPRAKFTVEGVPDELAKAILDARTRAGRGNAPPTYYAIIAMDGDKMGEWLSGKRAPKLRDTYHPVIRDFFAKIEGAGKILEENRPVSPALHSAISEALANFAVEIAPKVVEDHDGALVYSGGDDVLALVPCRKAAGCAHELQMAFQSEVQEREDSTPILMMGSRATISAGIAIVHYKNDLRDSLAHARAAEKRAKEAGRNAVAVAAVRRSGEHRTTLLTWDRLEELDAWVKAFSDGASDRWAYQLMTDVTSLVRLPDEALEAELRRRIARSDDGTKAAIQETFGADKDTAAGEVVAMRFRDFKEKHIAHFGTQTPATNYLEEYLAFVQTASFIARGREEE